MTSVFPPNQLGILLAACLALAACGTVSVKSTPPEADVVLRIPGKEEGKTLGKTPFEGDLGTLDDNVNSGTIIIEVTKKGFVPQQFVVPNLGGGRLAIEATLLPHLQSNYQEVNRIIALVLKAERLLLEKRLDEALKVSEEIKQVNENVSSAYEIEGTALFLKNQLDKSRFAWVRAIELEPNNPEAQGMLTIIEKKLGVTASAPAAKPKGKAK